MVRLGRAVIYAPYGNDRSPWDTIAGEYTHPVSSVHFDICTKLLVSNWFPTFYVSMWVLLWNLECRRTWVASCTTLQYGEMWPEHWHEWEGERKAYSWTTIQQVRVLIYQWSNVDVRRAQRNDNPSDLWCNFWTLNSSLAGIINF